MLPEDANDAEEVTKTDGETASTLTDAIIVVQLTIESLVNAENETKF